MTHRTRWATSSGDTNPGFQPIGFAAGLYDRDTGLVRFGARDYDPTTGRWTGKDPILFAGQQSNLYVYAGNDPIDYRDATGRFLESIFDDPNQRGLHQERAIPYEEFISAIKGYDLQMLTNASGIGSDSSGIGPPFGRYVIDPADSSQVIDMRHFLVVGQKGELFGLGIELGQLFGGDAESAFDAQALLSNALGAEFFSNYYNPDYEIVGQLRNFFERRAAVCR